MAAASAKPRLEGAVAHRESLYGLSDGFDLARQRRAQDGLPRSPEPHGQPGQEPHREGSGAEVTPDPTVGHRDGARMDPDPDLVAPGRGRRDLPELEHLRRAVERAD